MWFPTLAGGAIFSFTVLYITLLGCPSPQSIFADVINIMLLGTGYYQTVEVLNSWKETQPMWGLGVVAIAGYLLVNSRVFFDGVDTKPSRIHTFFYLFLYWILLLGSWQATISLDHDPVVWSVGLFISTIVTWICTRKFKITKRKVLFSFDLSILMKRIAIVLSSILFAGILTAPTYDDFKEYVPSQAPEWFFNRKLHRLAKEKDFFIAKVYSLRTYLDSETWKVETYLAVGGNFFKMDEYNEKQ